MTDVRPIDAEAMKSYIDCGHLRSPTEKCFSELDVVRMLDKQPTLDYAPVMHGEWVGLEFDGYADGCPVYDLWECSECKGEHKGEYDTLTDYCPNCGAKMYGGKTNG